MNTLIFLTAVCSLIIGLLFLYQPRWIARFNKIAREWIFNDNRLLFERRKKGVFFVLTALIFFYWGYHRGLYVKARWSEKLISTDRLLYQSLQHLYSREYSSAKALSERVLEREPNNSEALFQFGAAQILMDDPASGEISWAKAVSLDPNSTSGQKYKNLVSQLKNTSPHPSR